MKSKAVSGIMLILLFAGILTLTFNVQPAKASGTVYIRADGSVDPPVAPILNVGNVSYTFTDDIYDSIVVERDNVVIDGDGYTVKGTGNGIYLSGRSNVTIKNMEIKAFGYGIRLVRSSDNSISGNNITASAFLGILLCESSNNTISGKNINKNEEGIALWGLSNYNSISGNNITANNGSGIELEWSSNNAVSGNNTIAHNRWGISLAYSSNNIFYHNNFINNTNHASTDDNSVNAWDNGVEGNYWSNYTGVDANGDGIGDTPYEINENNTDRYPLMKTWSPPSAEEVPFWMKWWFWTTVATVIVASAGVVYSLKKRKTPTPTTSTLPIESTLQNTT